MKRAEFLTPVVTAFDAEGNIDVKANQAIYDFLLAGGIDGIVILGSTGEFFSMSMAQKKELVRVAMNYLKDRTKVYVGTTSMNVKETIELSNYALEHGADGVMIISPYYFTLSDRSVEYFYDQVAEAIDGGIYLYNFPARTGHDLSPEVTLNLLRKHSNIKGYKDTVTDFAHTRKLLQTVGEEFPDFKIYSGFDEFFAHNVLSGGNGCIGGLSNIYPGVFARWVEAINRKDLTKVAEIQRIVDQLSRLYDFVTPFVPILKQAMILKGLPLKGFCQKPILEPDERTIERIQSLLQKIDEQTDKFLIE